MVAIPTLDTPRLRLRTYRLDDFEAYAALWAEPAVVRFIGGTPVSREAAWTRFLRQIGLWHHLGFGLFALEDRATGAFIGEAGFHDLRRALTPSIEGDAFTGEVYKRVVAGQQAVAPAPSKSEAPPNEAKNAKASRKAANRRQS